MRAWSTWLHRTDLGGPWYEVKRLTSDPAEQAELVRRLVLELFDDGLVFGTYAKYREAYNLEWHEFTPVPREVIESELKRAEHNESVEGDTEEIEWFWVSPRWRGSARRCRSQPRRSSRSTHERKLRDGAV